PRFDREVRDPFFDTTYLGVAALGLVGAAFARRPSRTERLFLFLGGAAVLVALGRHAPFYSWAVAVLPPLGILRYPVKALLLAGFSWALLAGFGFDAFRRKDPPAPWRYRLAAGGPLLLVAAVAWAGHACLALPALRPWAQGALARLPLALPVEDVRLHLAARLWVTGSVAVLALVLVGLARRKWAWAPGAAAALALLAVLDLAKYHRYASLAPREMVLYRPEALALVGDPGKARLFVYDYLSPGPSVRHIDYPVILGRRPPGWTEEQAYALGMQAALGYASAQRWGARGGYEGDLRGLHPAPLVALTRRLRDLETTAAWTSLLRMGAVTHAVSLHDLGAPGLDPPAVVPGLFLYSVRVRRVADALPRAYAIGRTRIADDAAALARFGEPDWDPAQELVLPEGRASSPVGRFEGSARIVEERADRVVLEAELSEPGYVVLVDTFDPGWRAAVDGKPSPVLRANVAFRAVAAPAGRHVVSFEYRPWPVTAGLAVSVATAVLLAAFLVGGRRRAPAPAGAP
ncbi:MAG TPA: YfhO family protein, partial [Vicinamibacteria bacterium]